MDYYYKIREDRLWILIERSRDLDPKIRLFNRTADRAHALDNKTVDRIFLGVSTFTDEERKSVMPRSMLFIYNIKIAYRKSLRWSYYRWEWLTTKAYYYFRMYKRYNG